MKYKLKQSIYYLIVIFVILVSMLYCTTSFAWEVKDNTLYHAGQEYMILYQDKMYKVVRDSKGDYYIVWPKGSVPIKPEDLVWTIRWLIVERDDKKYDDLMDEIPEIFD